MFEQEIDHPVTRSRSAPQAKTIEQSSPPAQAPLSSSTLLGLQRAAGNASVAALVQRQAEENDDSSPVKELMRSGGGRPLDSPIRQFMESRLGADFGDVRVHTGAQATEAARSVQAHAYTAGTDVVFQDGQYDPGTSDGQKMLAHELSHVVQQKAGPVDGTPAPGGISISDPSDRFERAAEATAEKVMAGGTASSSSGLVRSAQRQEGAEAEEEELQMSSIQRQEGDEMEEEELQMSSVQRQEGDEIEDEQLQMSSIQRQEGEEMEEEEL